MSDFIIENGIITGYSGSASTVVIPTSGATKIGDGVFNGHDEITQAVIPGNITEVGVEAFRCCENLKKLTIEEGVICIHSCAFAGCTALKVVSIPSSVEQIMPCAFSGCIGVEKVEVDFDNLTYHDEQNCIVETDTLTVIFGCKNSRIIDDITTIGEGAFSGCKGLKSIRIPDSVSVIEDNAFYGCSGLTEIIIPDDGVDYIGKDAFGMCKNLTKVCLPDSLETIGSGAFPSENDYECTVCNGLKYLGNRSNPYLYLVGVDDEDIRRAIIKEGCRFIGDYALYWCVSLDKIKIPNSVTSIAEHAIEDTFGEITIYAKEGSYAQTFAKDNKIAFSPVKDLTTAEFTITSGVLYGYSGNREEMEIPEEVTEIAPRVFENNKYLKSVKIHGGVRFIGASAFEGCVRLQSVTTSEGLEIIQDRAFYGCAKLSEVSLASTLKQVGHEVFGDCENLKCYCENGINYIGNRDNEFIYLLGLLTDEIKTVNINPRCKFIGSYAFYTCKKLTSVEIPSGVIGICGEAFDYCSNLATVTLPDTLKYLGDYAFGNCSSLVSVEIPDSVEDLGVGVFASCKKLKTVKLSENIKHLPSETFDHCESLDQITLPPNLKNIGFMAFNRCEKLVKIVLPKSLRRIEKKAFWWCKSLEKVIIPSLTARIEDEAFSQCSKELVLCGSNGSFVQYYAQKHGMKFKPII
ncbi:MAG: leucine-rich repeat domain-containing protein [Clostridia bacterium]|nr:leucine-rich repeat domain-containing protein [Clostridia bacterium]